MERRTRNFSTGCQALGRLESHLGLLETHTMRIGINASGPLREDRDGLAYVINVIRAWVEMKRPHIVVARYLTP
jgi:hypothetical protein